MNCCRVSLNDCQPLASGNNRDVYVHPDQPDWLIKVVRPEAIQKRNDPSASWTKRYFRRYKHYETFLRECKEHIVSYLDPNGRPSFLHEVVGFADTDRGLGLVTVAVRNRDGAYAKTLSKLIAEGLFDEVAQKALDRFFEEFMATNVIITDLGHGNLVYDDRCAERPKFVVIDGYGEKNIIPYNSLFRRCHLRSKRKRVKRLKNSVARALQRRADRLAGNPT